MLKTEGYENSELFMALNPKNGVKASKLYSYKPINGNGDFVWTRALAAYRFNQEGVLELMGSNVPRIDYTNTCPELLIEKASTNLILHSEDFSNAYYNQSGVTIGTNAINAPNDALTADSFIETAANSGHRVEYSTAFTGGLAYTHSVFVKKGDRDFAYILFFNDNGVFTQSSAFFNLATGALATVDAGITARITAIGSDGWYRIEATRTAAATATGFVGFGLSNADNTLTYLGDITKKNYYWGAQIEQSDYATSYIPTTTTSVTRPKDVAYNTTNGFLDSAWSIVMRVRLNNVGTSADEPLISLNDGTIDNYFCIYTDANPKLHFTWYNNPDQDTLDTTDLSNGIYNIGISFDDATAEYIVVVNGNTEFAGTLVNNGTGVFSGFNRMDLGSIAGVGSMDKDGLIGLQYYNTALTQTDLENLTS